MRPSDLQVNTKLVGVILEDDRGYHVGDSRGEQPEETISLES